MAATPTPADADATSPRPPRRRAWLWLIPATPAALALASWWFTAPLADSPTPPPAVPAASDAPPPAVPIVDVPPTWPEGTLQGDAAKRLTLASVERSADRLARVPHYTATLRKQERLSGRLGPENRLSMKVRNRPFAIYLKFLAPKAGKEVVYAEGHHDNKVIAHNGDWTRRLVPRLAIDPHGPTALAENRHPITDAGLANLARKLVAFRKLDIEDADAVTVLERIESPEGKPWLRSVHLHSHQNPARPFARVEVLYDPETLYPLQISSYDWPVPGQVGDLLAERYIYQNLAVDPSLTALDFDPANPKYEFLRF